MSLAALAELLYEFCCAEEFGIPLEKSYLLPSDFSVLVLSLKETAIDNLGLAAAVQANDRELGVAQLHALLQQTSDIYHGMLNSNTRRRVTFEQWQKGDKGTPRLAIKSVLANAPGYVLLQSYEKSNRSVHGEMASLYYLECIRELDLLINRLAAVLAHETTPKVVFEVNQTLEHLFSAQIASHLAFSRLTISLLGKEFPKIEMAWFSESQRSRASKSRSDMLSDLLVSMVTRNPSISASEAISSLKRSGYDVDGQAGKIYLPDSDEGYPLTGIPARLTRARKKVKKLTE